MLAEMLGVGVADGVGPAMFSPGFFGGVEVTPAVIRAIATKRVTAGNKLVEKALSIS